jgi:hypothetical protein
MSERMSSRCHMSEMRSSRCHMSESSRCHMSERRSSRCRKLEERLRGTLFSYGYVTSVTKTCVTKDLLRA